MANYHESYLGFLFLYQILNADSTLAGLAPGGVWQGLAPPAEATPFVVLSHQAGTDSLTMNAFRMLVQSVYLIKVVGPAKDTATIAAAAARVDKLLGGPPGSPASGAITVNSVFEGQVCACFRESPLLLNELVAGETWSNIGGLYRLFIQQNAT